MTSIANAPRDRDVAETKTPNEFDAVRAKEHASDGMMERKKDGTMARWIGMNRVVDGRNDRWRGRTGLATMNRRARERWNDD